MDGEASAVMGAARLANTFAALSQALLARLRGIDAIKPVGHMANFQRVAVNDIEEGSI